MAQETQTFKKIPMNHDVYVKLEARAKEKGITVTEYVCELIDTLIARSKISFETVIIKVPTKIMAYIRDTFGDPKEHIEYAVVEDVKADLEARTGPDMAEKLELQEIFQTIVGAKAT